MQCHWHSFFFECRNVFYDNPVNLEYFYSLNASNYFECFELLTRCAAHILNV